MQATRLGAAMVMVGSVLAMGMAGPVAASGGPPSDGAVVLKYGR